MAAELIPFPKADNTNLITFDQLLDQIERLATVRHQQLDKVREAIFAEFRREAVATIRAAGFITPDY